MKLLAENTAVTSFFKTHVVRIHLYFIGSDINQDATINEMLTTISR